LLHIWLDPTGSLSTKQEKYRSGFHMEGLDRVVMNLKRTSILSSLHKTSMLAVVFSQPQQQSEKLRALFQDFDTDHNGTLSLDEFTAAIQLLSANRISVEAAKRLFEAIDVNHDQQISFTEFLAATLDPREVNPDELNKAFDLLDVEKKGYITGTLSSLSLSLSLSPLLASDLERVMDAKYRRNRKMSEKFNAKVTNPPSSRHLNHQKDSKVFASHVEDQMVSPEPPPSADLKFLPMSKFNFLKKYESLSSANLLSSPPHCPLSGRDRSNPSKAVKTVGCRWTATFLDQWTRPRPRELPTS
jgi:Ca2+-binding EF-hand superfamily protein